MDRSSTPITALALFALSAALGAQGIMNSVPAVIGFVDLSVNGGTAVTPPPDDDSEHDIFTTIGNPLFPAGNVRIGNNGVAVAGATIGEIGFSNSEILPTGVPPGFPTGNGIICVYWDDLWASIVTSIMWKEEAGVLYIMWKGELRRPTPTTFVGPITFEIQVFSSPSPGTPLIQLLYPDASFSASGAGTAFNNGLDATIGYVAGANPVGINLPWSFNTASVPDCTVLSIFQGDLLMVPTSPLGPGSIRLDIVFGPPNGTYFFAVTGAAGAFPHGWFFGLDIPYGELVAQASLGFPFVGPLDTHGAMTIGPIVGLPSDLTLYTVAVAFAPGSPVPTEIAPAVSHAIP